MSRSFPYYYGLDEKPCSQEEAFRLFGNANQERVVASDYIGDVHVSTVFLVLDHGFGSSEPILYETMIFGGKHDSYQRRYAHRNDALVGHIETTWMVEGRFQQWLRRNLVVRPLAAIRSVRRLVASLRLRRGM